MAKPTISKSKIVIDADKGLTFKSEDELFKHFKPEIDGLEDQYFKWKRKNDILDESFDQYEGCLEETLEDPDEIWRDNEQLIDKPITVYLKVYEDEESGEVEYYIALTYLTEDIPSFIYLHFPTNDLDLVERYRDGEIVFSKAMSDAPTGALDGDALSESDEFALGLYEAMRVLQSSTDIPESEYRDYEDYREETVEEADEIWRRADSMGNMLVTFIKDFSEGEEGELFYLAVTLEDTPSNSHVLLFSFPTTDKSLVDRYRSGENLHAEEVVQESSH